MNKQEPIISDERGIILTQRAREIAEKIHVGKFDAIVYLDRSARPVEKYIAKELNDEDLSSLSQYFVAIGGEQVVGYFRYLYQQSISSDTAIRDAYFLQFEDKTMFLNNMYTILEIDGKGGFMSRTQSPRVSAKTLDIQTIHAFFNPQDIERIKRSIKKLAQRQDTNTLRVLIVDDLKGAGITIQFAAAMLELLAQEVGVSLQIDQETILGYINMDPRAAAFKRDAETKAHMPWSSKGSHDGNDYIPVSEEGPTRLVAQAEPSQNARRLYDEILTAKRQDKQE